MALNDALDAVDCSLLRVPDVDNDFARRIVERTRDKVQAAVDTEATPAGPEP
ncbi:hypothetical protein [Streptomyces cyaneofuscatus]|uniref:hypothetical protein n=1 Tax=Streptomyces cyaneofuscatus TaxID=66883 RepID=UPI00344325F8